MQEACELTLSHAKRKKHEKYMFHCTKRSIDNQGYFVGKPFLHDALGPIKEYHKQNSDEIFTSYNITYYKRIEIEK